VYYIYNKYYFIMGTYHINGSMTSVLGAVGSLLLALCALPEVISSIRKGYCGASNGLLFTWLLGECLTLAYVYLTSKDIFLLLNYGTNVILILVLVFYKTKPVKFQPNKTISNFLALKERK